MNKIKLFYLIYFLFFIFFFSNLSFASFLKWGDNPSNYVIPTGLSLKEGYGSQLYLIPYGAIGESRIGGSFYSSIDLRNGNGKPFFWKLHNLSLFEFEISFTPLTFGLGNHVLGIYQKEKIVSEGKCPYEPIKDKYCVEITTNGVEMGGIQFFYDRSLLAIFKKESYGIRVYLPYGFAVSLSKERWTDFHIDFDSYVIDKVKYLNVISIHWPAVLGIESRKRLLIKDKE